MPFLLLKGVERMKGVVALIGVGVIIMMLGAMMAGINAFRGSTTFTEPHNITTDGNTTNSVIVLANEILDDATTNVTVVSTETTDAPVPYAYVAATHQLTVNGLAISKSRTLTIAYKVPSIDSFTDVAARYFPMFLILGAIGIVGGVIYGAVQNAKGG
jgi:hypothetical protein